MPSSSTDTLGGRLVVLGSILVGITTFALWFLGLGPFAEGPGTASRRGASEDVPLPFPAGPRQGPPVRYPALDEDPPTVPVQRSADFDPTVHSAGGPTTSRSLLHLLRLLPEGTSVLGMVRLDALRAQPWANDVLLGRKLPSLRARLAPLGLDLREGTRAVFGVALEARAVPAPAEGPDPRFLGKRDRPFALLVESPSDRKELLQRFRRVGPLTATEILGRRVYRRSGDYAMAFPLRGAVAWTYRRPMGPLLMNLLETPSGGAVTPEAWRTLEEAGLATRSPSPPGPSDAADGAEKSGSAPGSRDPAAQATAGSGVMNPPDPERPAVPGGSPEPSGAKLPTIEVTPSQALDAHLPWITLLWTGQAGQRPPYPLKSLAGYGPKSALRSALVTLGPGPQGGARLELRLLYNNPTIPPQMAALLRYARRHVARWPRVRRALLTELVDTVPIQVSGHQIRVLVELQLWHLRALQVLFHKLLEGGS